MKQRGFTLIEVLVAAAIFIFLSTLVSINLINIEPRISLNEQISVISSDIRKQQLLSMTGGSDSSSTSDFGVYLENNKYTLFAGSSYSAGQSKNIVVSLPANTQITNITIPGSTIVFKRNLGEINNFVNGSNTFKVNNSITNETKTVTFNKLGVITSVQ